MLLSLNLSLLPSPSVSLKNRCQFSPAFRHRQRLTVVKSAGPTSRFRLRRRTPPPFSSTAQFQELVSQFQNSTSEELKEKVVNLANFAYNPYNSAFLCQLNILELFLDCITEPNEKLVEFGIGGICNACVDPANAAVVTECDGIRLVVQCLSSPVKNTVNYALVALYYLCDNSNKEELLKREVVNVIKRYAAAEAVSVSLVIMQRRFWRSISSKTNRVLISGFL